MTWNKDHAKLKMAVVLFYQILFLFTSWFIIDTGSPWVRIGPRAPPPTTLHEWYHFDQGTLVNHINDATRKKLLRDMGFGHFSKLSQRKANLDNISSSNSHRIIILVSTPMFAWSKNRMKPLIKRLGHFYIANSKKSKMAASKSNFMTKSQCLNWKPNSIS